MVFLCQHRYLGTPVVVKALLDEVLDRDTDAVFAEARHVRGVSHPAVLGPFECGTAVTVRRTAAVVERPTPVFRADHPFLFLIRDTRSGSILFLGRLVNPK